MEKATMVHTDFNLWLFSNAQQSVGRRDLCEPGFPIIIIIIIMIIIYAFITYAG